MTRQRQETRHDVTIEDALQEIEIDYDLPSRWKQHKDDDGHYTVDTCESSVSSGSGGSPTQTLLEYDPIEHVQEWRTRVLGKIRNFTVSLGEEPNSIPHNFYAVSPRRPPRRRAQDYPPSQVNISLENSNLTLGEKKSKQVRFCLEKTEYHRGIYERTSTEMDDCFYTNAAIAKFQEHASKATNRLFGKSPSWKAWWSSRSPQDMNAVEYLIESYQTCQRAKSEHSMKRAGGLVHKEALQEMYTQYDEIIGLEFYALHSVVTTETLQVRSRILECAAVQRSHRAQSNLALFSQHASRPSRVLARELALAQAAVLRWRKV